MVPVIIAMGSNLGNRERILHEAVAKLAERLRGVQASGLYESEPMYVEDQPCFLNGVLAAATDCGPYALLDMLKRLEVELGREPRSRNGPREVDLDLLAYGSLKLQGPGLELPHPRWMERRFVVEPLLEISARSRMPASIPPGQELARMLTRDPLVHQRLVRVVGA